jgi:hypothetical protein
MAELYSTKYNNCERLDYNNTSLFLFNDGKILFVYDDADQDFGFQFDLYSEVGEIWRAEVDFILASQNVVLGTHDGEDGYYNVWSKES